MEAVREGCNVAIAGHQSEPVGRGVVEHIHRGDREFDVGRVSFVRTSGPANLVERMADEDHAPFTGRGHSKGAGEFHLPVSRGSREDTWCERRRYVFDLHQDHETAGISRSEVNGGSVGPPDGVLNSPVRAKDG